MHHSIMSHWPAATTDALLATYARLAPEVTFSLAYGGPAEEFEKIQFPHKLFIADPCLRGSSEFINFACWYVPVNRWLDEHHPQTDLVFFTEVDHLVLHPDYAKQLVATHRRSGCDVLGKWCFDTTGTNEFFHLRHRDDPALKELLARISTRHQPDALWTALGDGLLMSRTALQALSKVDNLQIKAFTEIVIPSVLHHLGFRLGDCDGYGDDFCEVRYRPDYEPEDVRQLLTRGVRQCHPYKNIEALPDTLALIEKNAGLVPA